MKDENEPIPFLRPELPDLAVVQEDFAEVYRSGIFSNGGPFEERLGRGLAEYLGGGFCLPVASATLGLMLAAAHLAKRDGGRKALLPSFTFAPSALALEWAGLEPVFCDIDRHSWQPVAAAEALLRRRDEFALILVCNTFGAPADIDFWKDIAERSGIPLLVDSAAGLGATYADGCRQGRVGCVEVFSIHATKAFASAEGGVIATNDRATFERLRELRNFGLNSEGISQGLGLNAKMSEFHAAIGYRALEGYEEILRQRRSIAAAYRKQLEPLGVEFQRHGEHSTYPFVSAMVPESVSRADLRAHLEERGIGTRHYFFPPLHHHPRYKSCERLDDLAVTDAVAQRIVSLPISNRFTQAMVERVCGEIGAVVRRR